MRILRIRLKNLNSLRGTWSIDLTHPEYVSRRIFAVTGPTGAGKTTIFDAVCLALYGQTPRLNTRNKGEIMSKHTTDCLASVEIETDGKSYVFTWTHSRTGDKANTTHTVSEDGRPITDKSRQRDAATLATELTGLDFKQFTQTVLLAQGEFDAFLSGSPTERAKILELITGTGIYSEISKRIAAHADKASDARDKAKIARDATTPHDGLGTNAEITQEIAQIRPLLAKAESDSVRLDESVRWLEGMRVIIEEIARVKSGLATLRKAAEDFAVKRETLEAGKRAREILPIFRELESKRKHYNDESARLNNTRCDYDDDSKKLAIIESELLPASEDELRLLTRGLSEGNTPDDIRSRIKSQLGEFMRLYEQKNNMDKSMKAAEERLTKAQAMYDTARQEEELTRKNLSAVMSKRATAILDGQRKRLKPGDICPLCGGLVNAEGLHKFSGNVDEASYDDENDALAKYQEAGRKLSQAQSDRDSARTALEHYRDEINECETRRLELRQSVIDMITPLGIRTAGTCDEIIASVDDWHKKITSLTLRITDHKSQVQALRGRISATEKMLSDGKTALEAMTRDISELERLFMSELRARNFVDELQFRASMLDEVRLTALQAEAQTQDDEMRKLQGVLSDREKRLSEESSKAITAMTLSEAVPKLRAKKEEVDILRRRLITLENAEMSRKKLQAEYDRLDEIYREKESISNDWEAFNRELGSKNGSKFGNFAQKITLRKLVQESNKQLMTMDSRYTLAMREDDDGLSLSVSDAEQGGQIRPTSNLSGGERFIISLSLALGLSQISGSKAQVDSLFIDEGFGSLDDDALNSALNALGEIQRDGRMIGIISHVHGISEAIPTKIRVIPKSEGTSTIIGPGVIGG